jgi:2-iminobutanoate/2-iminopropanoate deaminase
MSVERQVIAPPAPGLDVAKTTNKPQSMVVRGGEFVVVAGLTAVDPKTGARVPGTTAQETRQVLANMQALLEAAGSSMAKVVKVNVLLASMLEAPNMNEVYARFFPDAPPARTVCGARLPDGVRVMIECTALA